MVQLDKTFAVVVVSLLQNLFVCVLSFLQTFCPCSRWVHFRVYKLQGFLCSFQFIVTALLIYGLLYSSIGTSLSTAQTPQLYSHIHVNGSDDDHLHVSAVHRFSFVRARSVANLKLWTHQLQVTGFLNSIAATAQKPLNFRAAVEVGYASTSAPQSHSISKIQR